MEKMNIEEVYNGIIEYIKNGLEEYLINDDEIVTPMYKAILRNANADLLNLKVYPCLMLEYERTEEEVQEIGWDRVVMPLVFHSVVSGGDVNKCQIMVERYIMGLRKLFSQDRTLGGLTEKVVLNGWEFLPVMTRGQSVVLDGLLYVNFGLYLPR
jgi:hypothetical protein